MWADITGTWEGYRSEVEEILDLGEHVLTVARITGHGASGGVPIDQEDLHPQPLPGLRRPFGQSPSRPRRKPSKLWGCGE